MSNQLHQERATHKKEDHEGIENIPIKPQPKAEELSADVDDLLDEIDELLESDAEAFVAAYVQRGGQ